MTINTYHEVVERSYALRFEESTSAHVIETIVSEANALLAGQVKGLIFFPFSWKVEDMAGIRVRAVHLRADEASWAAFRSRGISATPVLMRRTLPVVARRRSVSDFAQANMALAG